MKLIDLFEQELMPGEKRIHTDIKVRNLEAIQEKIYKLKDHIYSSEILKNEYGKDPALQAALTNLVSRLERKLEYLNRMRTRPITSQTRMIQTLQTECSEFIQVLKQVSTAHSVRYLYRGMRGDASVVEGRSRTDRQPKDSVSALSDLLDHHLANLGFEALRRNSIFTTTSYSFAERYGDNVYIIFPKNGFHFLSTNERDMVLDSVTRIADDHLVQEYTRAVKQWIQDTQPAHIEDELMRELKDYLSWGGFSYVIKLINRMVELGEPYNVPPELIKQESDFVSDESVRQSLKPNQTDLATPMESGFEILINGSYWALKVDEWKSILNQELFGVDPYY